MNMYPNLRPNELEWIEWVVVRGIRPVARVPGGWIWTELCGIPGAPVVYKSRRAAIRAINACADAMRERGRDS